MLNRFKCYRKYKGGTWYRLENKGNCLFSFIWRRKTDKTKTLLEIEHYGAK